MTDTLFTRMRELGIDVERSQQILERFNAGEYDNITPVEPSGIPGVDGRQVVDRTQTVELNLPEQQYRTRLRELAPEIPADRFGTVSGSGPEALRNLDQDALQAIGVLLYPYLSYGVLNGGSATSYGDLKKNESFDSSLLELYRPEFERLAPEVTGRPKGITPAWLNPDGTPGASFLELKFRMLLLAAEHYRTLAAKHGVSPPESLSPVLPFFEMTSHATEDALRDAYRGYRESPLLKDLPGVKEALDTRHAVQPLLAALTHSDRGRPKQFFTEAWGKIGEPLGIPGGHGQNFQVLAPIYRELRRQGKRFVYLGNVDNLGFTVDPVSLAFMALRGAPAAFDFAYRTPVDVKGGVLVFDQDKNLNCADIGAAISKDEVFRAESRGEKILFNCATGLFDLDNLCDNLDAILDGLPMRISDQHKDAGKYSQAEQVTWEVIAMLKEPIVFGIDKYRRFLAAKMLLETLLTSGLHADQAVSSQPTARNLHEGLKTILTEEYGMELRNRRWVPRAPRAWS